jgi:hypothetical protein
MTVQPTVRFGYTGTLAGLVAAVITTNLLANFDRERFQTLVSYAGRTSLTAGVTVVATATTMNARYYWKGHYVEDDV